MGGVNPVRRRAAGPKDPRARTSNPQSGLSVLQHECRGRIAHVRLGPDAAVAVENSSCAGCATRAVDDWPEAKPSVAAYIVSRAERA